MVKYLESKEILWNSSKYPNWGRTISLFIPKHTIYKKYSYIWLGPTLVAGGTRGIEFYAKDYPELIMYPNSITGNAGCVKITI